MDYLLTPNYWLLFELSRFDIGKPLVIFFIPYSHEGFELTNEESRGSGFGIGRDVAHQMEITHLLFADDTLVFCDADVSQLRYLRCILVCFQLVSWLKINVGKTVLVLVGDVLDISSLAAVLGCGVGDF
ncbi:uncharacterized protein LOC132270331 [Cornus florida]|uniref:uncharacterized protein LOC132270331 n=1 Tax=Cornus florida TaxID=4283 RepID=UPI0028972D2A|nr:uncharacterized protein LOC132270331 [Cornus florida]